MIKNIKISNYKNLDGFEFDGFGRLNLITGKNNVGKTNLLEAMCLGLDEINVIKNIYSARNIENTNPENLFTNFNSEKDVLIAINNKPFNLKDGILEVMETNNKSIVDKNINFTYISSNQKLDGKILAEYFTHIIRNNKKLDLIKILKIVDKNIDDIQILIDKEEPNIFLTKNEITLPISFFGDATQKLFDIFARIFLNENIVILIDEIENGIYYENQKKFWSTLSEISKITNCQIIATTHSIEMIKNFYEVTKDERDCKLLKLVRNIDNEILMREMEKDLIEYILEDKHLNESDVLR